MCTQFDRQAVKQCREDDAEEVIEKARLNFCEWFIPSESDFNSGARVEEDRAKARLDTLFSSTGETVDEKADDNVPGAAENLFK